jgi:arylsulfatase A-like enzyme
VGDALVEVTGGRALVAALSTKERAAVLSGGKKATLALWLDDTAGRHTTSRYYAPEPPRWLDHFQREHPPGALLTSWTLADPVRLEAIAGPDDRPGEGDYLGLGVTFPHDPRAATQRHDALRLMPTLVEQEARLAKALAAALGLGADDTTDLLVWSISGTDYVGHTFGADSLEYFEMLRRSDRALGWLLDGLEREHGPIAVLVTSDHGALPMPESIADRPAGRVHPGRTLEEARRIANEILGEGEWLLAFPQPLLHFSDAAREPTRRARLVTALRERLTALPGVHSVFDVREARGWRESADELERTVANGLPPDVDADLVVVTDPGFAWDDDRPPGKGTSHGSPWDYDRDVPVVFWGAGVTPAACPEPLSQTRVAPTIAALLGVPPPAQVRESPLPGAPNR